MPKRRGRPPRTAPVSTVTVSEQEPMDAGPPTEEPSADDDARALSDLAKLALRLSEAASDSEEEQTAADRIFRLIGSLSKGAQRRLFDNADVRRLFEEAGEREKPASPSDPPGTIYYRNIQGERVPWFKKPWTWADLYNPPPPRQPMPTKTWIPDRRVTLGWNGLMVTVLPRRPVTLPEVFYGVYEDSMVQSELAEQHSAYIFGASDRSPNDPSMMTMGTAVARATSMRGRLQGRDYNLHNPGGGFVAIEMRPDDESTPGQ